MPFVRQRTGLIPLRCVWLTKGSSKISGHFWLECFYLYLFFKIFNLYLPESCSHPGCRDIFPTAHIHFQLWELGRVIANVDGTSWLCSFTIVIFKQHSNNRTTFIAKTLTGNSLFNTEINYSYYLIVQTGKVDAQTEQLHTNRWLRILNWNSAYETRSSIRQPLPDFDALPFYRSLWLSHSALTKAPSALEKSFFAKTHFALHIKKKFKPLPSSERYAALGVSKLN